MGMRTGILVAALVLGLFYTNSGINCQFPLGVSGPFYCTSKDWIILQQGFSNQERPNYCGIAVMQLYDQTMSQDEITMELHKGPFDLVYWGDFKYFFERRGIQLKEAGPEDFPRITLIRNPGHFILIMTKNEDNELWVYDPHPLTNPIYRIDSSRLKDEEISGAMVAQSNSG
jgi:hypothetical protein